MHVKTQPVRIGPFVIHRERVLVLNKRERQTLQRAAQIAEAMREHLTEDRDEYLDLGQLEHRAREYGADGYLVIDIDSEATI